VLRTRSEVLVARGEDIVGSKELEEAAARAAELARVLQTASKKKLSILRSDARDLLDRVFEGRSPEEAMRDVGPRKNDRPGLSGQTSTVDESAPRGVLSRLMGAVNEAMDPSGLAFVPKVVHALAPDVDRETAKAALLDAASRGLLELRPETGLGRLSEAELLSCPEGAQGMRLSWARCTKESV
jgi:hypothetical protein